MKTKTTVLPKVLPKSFAELCRIHLPRPIGDEVDYENTAEIVDRLATLAELSREQDEYLQTLTILVEKYDQDNFAATIGADPITRLRRLTDAREMSASDLGRVLGNRALGAAILRGDRAISKANAVRLAKFFKMQPAAFMQF